MLDSKKVFDYNSACKKQFRSYIINEFNVFIYPYYVVNMYSTD